jgi:CheY-like chemotaxis protein
MPDEQSTTPKKPTLPLIEMRHGIRSQGFQYLMRFRVRDILLVSSLYDYYIFVEDGRLHELIRREYSGLDLSHTPDVMHASSGEEALDLLGEQNRFDLVVMTLHIEDMQAARLAKMIRQSGLNIPIVLLAYDNRQQNELISDNDAMIFDRIFIWQGDARILFGIIKTMEDRINVENDTESVGVQSIILIEDNVKFYSSYLPIVYTEIMEQSRRLISESLNASHRYLRMRARPKILLCTTYEEAWSYFEQYENTVLGIISDIDFKHNGVDDPDAGIEFTRAVKARHPDIPILLQSNNPGKEKAAHELGASFLMKDSPVLLHELREFMAQYFSFGDFVFRTPDGREVGRANDLRSLEQQLLTVPVESITYHAERNHFSNWLKARTEFWLAHKLRPRKVSEFASPEDLRQRLIEALRDYHQLRQFGQITDFSPETFDPGSTFARIGGGSLGGKARGLGFINQLINNYDLQNRFEGVQIRIPSGIVIGTDVFDQFLEEARLRDFALRTDDDGEITRKFLETRKFPRKIRVKLAEFLDLVRVPLAVRSSTLLEDSQYHPFAGVYETYMIPNNNPNPVVRLNELVATIKRVYASTFYRAAKEYIKVTSYRLEEEKMAVIVQTMVGVTHETRFYPDISGVAKSHNFYPVPPQKPRDGIVSVALGLGKIIADGGTTLRFCPKYPNHLVQFHSAEETLRNSQTEFFSLQLDGKPMLSTETHDQLLLSHPLGVAEKDGPLQVVGSTYSAENDAIYDGLSRNGVRVVTFAPILRNKIFPLPQAIELMLELGSAGMGTPVEMEFAANVAMPRTSPQLLSILQIRPLVLTRENEELNVEVADRSTLIAESSQVLGNGAINSVRDIVVVDFDTFDRARSRDVAKEVSELNHKLVIQHRPYILIGVGRWGTLDPWLGIPVTWDQISGAKAIVEACFKDFSVTPSQGSHFFQNITSFMVGYFTIGEEEAAGFVDWAWLAQQTAVEAKELTRHLEFDTPVVVRMNGHLNKGIIMKPSATS